MIQKFFSNIEIKKLINASFILFAGSMFVNVINYIFQLVMGRMLTTAEYGIFSALTSTLYVFLVLSSTLQNAFIPHVSQFKAKNNLRGLRAAFLYLTKTIFLFSFSFFIFTLIISRKLADFLKIEDITPVIILDFVFIISILLSLNRSVLQGLLKFKAFVANNILEMLLKLLGGVLLVILGFKVNGAISGLVISMFIAYGLSFFPLKELFQQEKTPAPHLKKKHIIYSSRILITMLCLVGFYTIDVLLVKHYFSEHEAGLYGALSMIGKIIFFGTAIVSQALLPLSSDAHANNNTNHRKFFWYSFILVTAAGVIATVIYSLWPEFIIGLLYGKEYLEIKKYLAAFAVFMTLYSLLNLVITYLVSLKDIRYLWFIIIGLILQIVFITAYHDNFFNIITNSSLAVTIVLTCSLFFVIQKKKSSLNVESKIQ